MKKPSQFVSFELKKVKWLLPWVKTLMWCGKLLYKTKEPPFMTPVDSNHERIHVRQAEGTHDSWFRYYFTYCWRWLCNITLIFIDVHAPYKFNDMELEAYCFQEDMNYCLKDGATMWKEFKKQHPIKSKRKYAKIWYADGQEGAEIRRNGFTRFIKDYMGLKVQ